MRIFGRWRPPMPLVQLVWTVLVRCTWNDGRYGSIHFSERPYQPLVDAEPECDFDRSWEALWTLSMDALVADQFREAAAACGEDRMFCVREVATEGYDALEILTAALDAETMPAELQYAKDCWDFGCVKRLVRIAIFHK